MPAIFETERLILRRFTDEDAGLLLALNSDPEVLKFLHEPVLQSLEQSKKILVDVILPQYELNLGRWAVHKKADQEFIGWCGLKSRPELNEIDLGYRFMRSEWGKGFATEVALQTMKYGFETLRLKMITGRAHIENFASIKVLEKIGMHFIGESIVDDCPVRTYTATNV